MCTTPLAYIIGMRIIETPFFTQRIQRFLSDEEYRQLQQQLVAWPDAGKLIPGSGGLRKLRWAMGGHGKREASESSIIERKPRIRF